MTEPTAPTLPTRRVIYNKVMLLLASARRVSNPDNPEDTDTESLNFLWDIARRAAIVLHPWNFAIGREKLYREAGAPSELGPAYSYTTPVHWLRWLPWDGGSEFHFDAVEEGDFLLSNHAGPIIARGLIDVPDVTKWPPLFVDAMAYTLAIEFCQAKTELMGLRDRLTSDRTEKLAEAFRVDGLSTPNRPRPSHHGSRWVGARYRHLGIPR